MKKINLILIAVLVPSLACAEALTTVLSGYITAKLAALVGVSIAAWCVGFALRKIPVEDLKNKVGQKAYKAGKFVTDWFQAWKYTKAIWNTLIEPWLITLIRNVILEALSKFIDGLKFDNPDENA